MSIHHSVVHIDYSGPLFPVFAQYVISIHSTGSLMSFISHQRVHLHVLGMQHTYVHTCTYRHTYIIHTSYIDLSVICPCDMILLHWESYSVCIKYALYAFADLLSFGIISYTFMETFFRVVLVLNGKMMVYNLLPPELKRAGVAASPMAVQTTRPKIHPSVFISK